MQEWVGYGGRGSGMVGMKQSCSFFWRRRVVGVDVLTSTILSYFCGVYSSPGILVCTSWIVPIHVVLSVDFRCTQVPPFNPMNEQQRSSSTMSDCIPCIIPYVYDGSGDDPWDVTKVIVKDTVTKLDVFSGCTFLTSIRIPNSMTELSQGVFLACTSLTSVTIPNSVIKLGHDVVWGWTAPTSVTIHATVSVLDNCMFYNCTTLESITLLNTVTTIESYNFYDLKSLISVALPPSLEIVGD